MSKSIKNNLKAEAADRRRKYDDDAVKRQKILKEH